MKQLILIFFVLALIEPVFSHEKQKDSTTFGYYVVIKNKGKFETPLKTQSLAEVYAFIQVSFPDFCAELEKELKTSPAFMQITFNSEIYVEKKLVAKKGKYKRLKIKTKNLYL